MSVSSIVSQITSQISKGEPLNTSSLLTYITSAMELIETVPKMSGDDKLNLLKQVVSQIIASSSLPDNEKANLQTLSNVLLPTFTSLICQATKGLLDINLKTCFSFCRK